VVSLAKVEDSSTEQADGKFAVEICFRMHLPLIALEAGASTARLRLINCKHAK